MGQVKFIDLPADVFPFTAEWFRVDTREIVHTIVVSGPGSLEVPALVKEYGVEMMCRLTFPDGEVIEG